MKKMKKIQMAVLMLLIALLLAACSNNATPTTSSTSAVASTTSVVANTTSAADNTMSGQTDGGTPAAGTAQPTFMPASSNQTPTVEPSTGVSPTAIAVVDPNLKTTLSIWSGLSGNQSQLLNDQVKQFAKAYPGVKVNVTTYNPDEIEPELQSATTAGNAPDLIFATSDYVSDFTSAKLVQPVGSLFNSQAYAANALAPSSLNGQQYGVPYIYGNTLVLAYNKRLVQTPPTTTDQLIQMAQQIQKQPTATATAATTPTAAKGAYQRNIGLIVDANEPVNLTPWVYGFGGTLLDANGQPSLNTPAMTQSLQFMSDLVYKDKLINSNYEPTRNQADYEFRDGTLAFYITTDTTALTYDTGNISATSRDPNGLGLDLGIAPLPTVSATGKQAAPFTDSQAIFVGAKTTGDHLTAAKDFFSYIASTEQQTYMASNYRLLPPTTAALNSDAVTNNPGLSGVAAQLVVAIPQPSQPQMQAVWDAMRPSLEQTVANVIKPAAAAQTMQQAAVAEIQAAGLAK